MLKFEIVRHIHGKEMLMDIITLPNEDKQWINRMLDYILESHLNSDQAKHVGYSARLIQE